MLLSTFQMKILDFLLHNIYLTAVVTFQIKILHKKRDKMIKYSVSLKSLIEAPCHISEVYDKIR